MDISSKDMELLRKKYPHNLDEVLNRIKDGYPIQYLIGNVEFLNTIINVDERVLIPRFETELLVDKTIKYIKDMFNKKISIIDLGTGSGCIAITLKKNTNSFVTALDISKNALDLAKENADNNKVDIIFINGDMEEKLSSNYDVIISNPPYIPINGYVSESVKNNEPSIALYAQDNGIYYYKQIINNHLKKLNKPGLMAFEIGDNEKVYLEEFLKEKDIINYKFENDLTNRPRYLFIFNE